MRETTGYSRLQIALHWAVAGLILTNYVLSDAVGADFRRLIDTGGGGSLAGGGLHVWIGVTVLSLVLLRVAVRLVSGAPEAPEGTPDLMRRASVIGHLALYALMLAVPVFGAMAWFLGIAAMGDVHVLSMNAMMLLILAHAGAALFHQFVRRDGLLLRMVRPH